MGKVFVSVIRTMLRMAIHISILAFCVALVTKAGTYFYQYTYDLASKTPASERPYREVLVTVPQGAGTKEIADLLHENDLVASAELFRLIAKTEKVDGQLKSGTYYFNTTMDDEAIMALLMRGAVDENAVKIQIPEGYTATQIAEHIESLGLCSAKDFMDVMNNSSFDYDFVKNLPDRKNKLEGYLFPDTYFVKEDATPEEIISKMLARFDQIYEDQMKDKALEMNLSLDKIVTMASIVEAEIRVPEERPKAAAVIYNRLDDGMRLEMCSTILYALGKRKEKLNLSDLEVESPYNTYRNAGLPVGPINNPGLAAIEAVLSPNKEDYLFFVIKDEQTGEHEFTDNYDEFLAAKARYNQVF